jgi:hypothetical protein
MKDTRIVIGINQSSNEIGTTNWFSHGFDTNLVTGSTRLICQETVLTSSCGDVLTGSC